MADKDYGKKENSPIEHLRGTHPTNLAFVVHRNKNKNVVVYTGNVGEDGNLVQSEPIKVHWVMYEQKGCPTEGLNVIERNSAYGVSAKPCDVNAGHYQVQLTSLKDRVIDLHVADGKVVGKGSINGVDNCTLERVFVQSTTSWGMPKVEYIEIFGTDPEGNAIVEHKKP